VQGVEGGAGTASPFNSHRLSSPSPPPPVTAGGTRVTTPALIEAAFSKRPVTLRPKEAPPNWVGRVSIGMLSIRQHTVIHRIGQHTSAYSQRTSAYVKIREHTSAYVSVRQRTSAYVSVRQRTSAYVSMRQHTCAGKVSIGMLSIRQHTSAYVSIRQHTSAYVSIR
jgi:hypothetical protein